MRELLERALEELNHQGETAMKNDLPHIFKDHEIMPEEICTGEWEAYIMRLASGIATGRELVPDGPFPTEEAAHKNAINFLVRSR